MITSRIAYYDSHPYWLLMREEAIDLIELLAGYTTGRYDHCYDIAISGAADKEKFVAEAKAKSDFDDGGMEILPEDHLLTLSTCAYKFKNARYIAIGKLVPVWRKWLSETRKRAALEPKLTVRKANGGIERGVTDFKRGSTADHAGKNTVVFTERTQHESGDHPPARVHIERTLRVASGG